MTDSRFPFLFTCDTAPGVAPEVRRAMVRLAEEVRERVDCRVLFDTRDGSLFVHLAHDITQGLSLPPSLTGLMIRPGQWDLSALGRVDELCRVIRSGRISWAIRDREDAMRRQSYAAACTESRRQFAESMRPEMADVLRFTKGRMGMGSRFRRSHVVNGFAGKAAGLGRFA